MHDNSRFIDARVRRFIAERILPSIYGDPRSVEVTAWPVPDEPVPFSEAVAASYLPFAIGTPWGAPWSTTWFHLTGIVPAAWTGADEHPELIIDLGFKTSIPGFQVEGTVYTADGVIVKAIESMNRYVRLGAPGSEFDLYVEAAANPNILADLSFAQTALGDKATAGGEPLYRLNAVILALRHGQVWELQQDLLTLLGLAAELSPELPRRAEILLALDRAIDVLDVDDIPGTATLARGAIAAVLASPAYASAHRISAVGHAHIDSAWLWPVRETVRKVARTFSNVLDLMDQDPDVVFAASSAQQYSWLKQYYPELFERVKARVADGRFAPVGGMWVEADTNMPGGEALVRQFVAGKRFFMEEFGVEPLEVWLPDSFGYSGALPQIVAAAGSRWFLTQKISWNDTNRMPHHTFDWEGIDGTKVFTHFPPLDTYNGELSAAELARAERQYGEKGQANSSLAPFGWGDGGGGPTREMVAAAHRANDLEGSPRVTLRVPREFFEAAEAEYQNRPVWQGELYLEFHRGSYTSQAATKKGNRRSEQLLREAELWATLASVRLGSAYQYDALEEAWHTVLLQQFHDILPGSSIAWVHREAERNYAELATRLQRMIGESIAELAGTGDSPLLFNAGPYPLGAAPALGAAADGLDPTSPNVVEEADRFILQNRFVRATIDRRGLLVSVHDLIADREVIPEGSAANVLQLFRDIPTQWDAWDVDADYINVMRELTDIDAITIVDDGRAVRVTRTVGASRIEQIISLGAESSAIRIVTRVDWHERQKLLKLSFPLDLRAERAASEIQFGHIFRPTHANTSWDNARYETVAHRWVHVGEAGYGVAIANDSTYGHDIRSASHNGAAITVARLSLLRAPRYPDPEADQGEHEFTVSFRVGAAIPDAVAEGYRLNLPLRRVTGSHPVAPALSLDNPAVVVEAIKLAEDRSGDVIVRLYEAHGTRARAVLTAGFDWKTVTQTDLLERALAGRSAVTASDESGVSLTLRPFQIVTLRFAR
jgi:alpha-mannosidase